MIATGVWTTQAQTLVDNILHPIPQRPVCPRMVHEVCPQGPLLQPLQLLLLPSYWRLA